MLYNNDMQLWKSAWESYNAMTCGGAVLYIREGMVGDGNQMLARFATDKEAKDTLQAAGFHLWQEKGLTRAHTRKTS